MTTLLELNAIEMLQRNRRSVLKLGLAGGAASLLGVPALATRPQVARAQSNEVRVGFQKGAPTLMVLKAQGEFEKRLGEIDLAVTWTEFQAGPPLLEALNAGAIDFGLTGAPPPIFAQAAGADLVYILATNPSPHTEAIIVPPDSPIQELADLKGKKVAVTKGSSANALLVIALQAGGLQWGDAEPVYLLPADAKAAYEGGSVDAWSIWDPYLAIEETDTNARTIATAGDVDSPNHAFYLASRTFATESEQALRILQDTLADAEAWSDAHPEEVAKLINGETGIDLDILLRTEERRTFGVVPITEEIVADQQRLADLFHEIGLIPERLDIRRATLLTQTTA
jgi:sulfonate transport system substrate-binding protein